MRAAGGQQERRGQPDPIEFVPKQGLEQAKEYDEFVVLHASPVRVRAGMVVHADGTNWNPGSGAGMYRRNAANSAWVHLG